MKTIKYTGLLLLLVCTSLISNTQVKYADNGVNILVKGTSNLHDWEIKSDKGIVDATVSTSQGEKTVNISKLNFLVNSKTFKSGHSGMDKNVYKALQADKHPSINFELIFAPSISADGNVHAIKALGRLTIAGVTKQVELAVTCKWNSADKSLVITGARSIRMTEYSVKPPTALLGTIKTGDQITIDFYVRIAK